jgi:ribosome biogenesis GTPase
MERTNSIVIKNTGSNYLVSHLPEWNPVKCTVRGKLRLKGDETTNPIAVGDVVDYDETGPGEGVIMRVHPRKNYIIRKSTNLSRKAHIIASNLDMVFLIVTVDFPEVKLAFIDRFLVTCEAYRVPVTIVVNKCDAYDEFNNERVESFLDLYKSVGYPVIKVSALTGENIDLVRDLCRGKISLFSGQSGVGKSTLIKALDSSIEIKTGDISTYHNQGKHTTTFYEMHALSSGGFIIDTPGIKGFGLIEMDKEELSHYFREMLPLLEKCRFSPCTHTHEPGCAVKEAVECGIIAGERYDSYLGMLEEEEKYR